MAQAIAAPQHGLHSVTDWKAGAGAGVVAGLVFVMLEMGTVWMFQGHGSAGLRIKALEKSGTMKDDAMKQNA